MLEPFQASQWNETTAAHLLNRAGFGGSPQDIANVRQIGLEAAVSWLVDFDRIADDTPAPEWTNVTPDEILSREAVDRALDDQTRRIVQQERARRDRSRIFDLRYWWLRRMALGPRPLQEKMTLFWHGHFATSFEKVTIPYLLWQQNETLRQNALARFNVLLTAVARDPAMLRYLDGANSNKAKPNENFAREVLELFALGEGHYTEQDIQQSAKAYTGWGIGKDRLHYQYNPNNHDPGSKTVFGQTGNFTGEEVLDLICAQPQCAKFICTKVWRFFVQDQPPGPLMDALAVKFQSLKLDLKELLRTIFLSREFYAPEVIRSQVKSPVQWLVSSVHQLQSPLPTEPMSLTMLTLLGQDLFQPPNVKGWDGGVAWITTNSMLDRFNFAAALVEGKRVPIPVLVGRMHGVQGALGSILFDLPPLRVDHLFTPQERVNGNAFLDALQARLLNDRLRPQRLAPLQDFLKDKSPITDDDVRKAIRLLMSTPEYQLT